jgi:hypothetical protein
VGIPLKFCVTPRLVEVMIKLSERHGAHRSPAGDDIPVADQYQPLGGRMKLMASIEEVHSGGTGQPLARDHHCYLITNVEPSKCCLRGVGGDNAVVGCEPSGEVALDGSTDVAIAVDGKQHRLGHTGYPGPAVFAPPVGPGSCTKVSSV